MSVKIVLTGFLNINSICISQWTKHQVFSHLVHIFPSEAGTGVSQLIWYKHALLLLHSPHTANSASEEKQGEKDEQ